jgi:predicted Zn-dependent protease
LAVRQNIVQPMATSEDSGAMLTVYAGDGMGYAATGDVSLNGLQRAAEQAHGWARQSAGRSVVDFSKMRTAPPTGEYATHELIPWRHTSLSDKIDLLRTECARLKTDDRIVDWDASLWYTETDTLYLTTAGGRVYQHFVYLVPMLSATANAGSETQTRTFGGRGYCRQGGMEVLDVVGFRSAAPQLAAEALQLLTAPNCPSEVMDVLLAPDQMILQIHESVGHPLELDRILGDERNYAGTSFVTPDMCGTYRYGSDLLNITFDPTRPEQYVSYGFDDDGQPAQREYLIRQGILQRASITVSATCGHEGWRPAFSHPLSN